MVGNAVGRVPDSVVYMSVGATVAATVAEATVSFAHRITATSLSASRYITSEALNATDQLFELYGVPNGVSAKLAFGKDAGEALLFIQRVLKQFGGLPPGMSLTEAFSSISALAWLHQAAGVTDPRVMCNSETASSQPDPHTLELMKRYLPFAMVTYGHVFLRFLGLLALDSDATGDLLAVAALTGNATVLESEWEGSTYCPGFVLSVDHGAKAIVLALRGTVSIHDVLTDLVCQQQPFLQGAAHSGMMKAAEMLLERLWGRIETALVDHPGHSLVLTGHSLGAGTATLLASLIGSTVVAHGPTRSVTVNVHCYAFAPPAVLSLDLARACQHVTSVIVGPDLVPRLSLATTIEVKELLAALNWDPQLESDIQARSENPQADDAAFAREVLGGLEQHVSVSEKLYPGGTILWTSVPSSASEFTVVDQKGFDSIVLIGTDALSSHMPQAYAEAALGEVLLPIVLGPS